MGAVITLAVLLLGAADPPTAPPAAAADDPCARRMVIPATMLEKAPRFIVVGETHGTDTSPEAFGDMVCAMLRDGPVLVQLELPAAAGDAANAFVQSGDGEALARLKDSWVFTGEDYDGRGSAAFLAMIARFRSIVERGHRLTVMGSQPPHPSIEPQYYYELAMAAAWAKNAAEQPEAVNMILVGTYHAERNRHEDQGAAAFLRDGDAVSLAPCEEGGTASVMAMEDDGAIVSSIIDLSLGDDRKPRGVHPASTFIDPPGYAEGAFDGFYCAGRLAAASPRAVDPSVRREGE